MNSVFLVVELGLLYAVPAIASMFAFRIIGFPDLTPDGSFTFGAAVCGILLLDQYDPVVAMSLAFLAGAAAGVITVLLHIRLGVSKLLSGILVMTMLYSLSLRVMETSNLSLRKVDTLLGRLGERTGDFSTLIIVVGMVAVLAVGLVALLKTRAGLFLRATGDSATALSYRGVTTDPLLLVGLALSNGLAALGGAVVAQFQGFVDITMGTGIVIISLTAIIIGETLLRPGKVIALVVAPALGMMIYQGVIAAALRFHLAAADLKIATALLALTFVASDRLRHQRGQLSHQIGNRDI